MQCQRSHQPDADNRLDNQTNFILTGTLVATLIVKLLQHFADFLRQRFAVAKTTQLLHQQAGQQATNQNRNGHWRHAQEEIAKMPASCFSDDQVLWFAHHGHHAA